MLQHLGNISNRAFFWRMGINIPENLVFFAKTQKRIGHHYVWSALLAAVNSKWDHIFFLFISKIKFM